MIATSLPQTCYGSVQFGADGVYWLDMWIASYGFLASAPDQVAALEQAIESTICFISVMNPALYSQLKKQGVV